MVRLGSAMLLVALTAASCSIDRIEWESGGYAVEAAARELEENERLEHPQVECIKREVGGSLWECRAHTHTAQYACTVHAGAREKIHSVHCHREDEHQPAEAAALWDRPQDRTDGERQPIGRNVPSSHATGQRPQFSTTGSAIPSAAV